MGCYKADRTTHGDKVCKHKVVVKEEERKESQYHPTDKT